jgi:hypothetical protein
MSLHVLPYYRPVAAEDVNSTAELMAVPVVVAQDRVSSSIRAPRDSSCPPEFDLGSSSTSAKEMVPACAEMGLILSQKHVNIQQWSRSAGPDQRVPGLFTTAIERIGGRKLNRMRISFWVVGLLAVLCIAIPSAHADSVVAFTAPFGTAGGGVYTSPYYGTIDGQAVSMICDSYLQSVPGSPWLAEAHSFSNLTGARFYDGSEAAQHNYNAAAYLGDMLLGTLSSSDRNKISYALWALFLPDPDSQYNAFFDDTVAGWVNRALGATQGLGASAYANWTAYTPIQGSSGLRPDQIQEYLVRTPESPAMAVLGLNLSGLLGLIVLFRRRLVR